MSKDNGGPAFPFVLDSAEGMQKYEGGMTLRDYMAVHASEHDVQDILSKHMEDVTISGIKLCRPSITRQQARYMHADAMLLERAK